MRRTNNSSSDRRIDIATCARRVQVDNRFSLRYYHRVADNILRQADIFRAEKNIIDLYVMLLRFSSLVSETIPLHREYRAYSLLEKNYFRKKLLNSLNELEKLKPAVALKVNELNQKHAQERNGWSNNHLNNSSDWPLVDKKASSGYQMMKAVTPLAQTYVKQGSRPQQVLHTRPVEQQFSRISLNFPRPNEETLSKHSILGPQGLYGQWQPPKNSIKVSYPSNIDWSPVEIPRLPPPQSGDNGHTVVEKTGNADFDSQKQSAEDELVKVSDTSNSEPENESVESILNVNNDNQRPVSEEPGSLISFESDETPVQNDIIRQPSPPAVLAEVQDLVPLMSSQVTEAENKIDISSPDSLIQAEPPLQLHISTTMMDSFLKLAKSNTKKRLETCGVLAGTLKDRKFYITALIIPKQEATENSCQATHEEEIFDVQDKRSLFPLGWIHTHPTQSCFMSSIDVHTHYSYQVMLPEAVSIVMAPTDSSRKHGIFRLTTPGGMSVIRQCQLRGFHAHDPPPDGGPIYQTCADVYMNPNLNFEVIDLR